MTDEARSRDKDWIRRKEAGERAPDNRMRAQDHLPSTQIRSTIAILRCRHSIGPTDRFLFGQTRTCSA